MVHKKRMKTAAIILRRRGMSYSEILEKVPVAKSTLGLWLKDIGLSKKQIQRLTEKKLAAGRRGGEARRQNRISATQSIYHNSAKEIGNLSNRELWLSGIMLYWAEGSKEKEHRPGSGVQFTNSDPEMIRLFLKWLKRICGIGKENIYFDIFIHENHAGRINEVIAYWVKKTGFSEKYFPHIYLKKNKIKTMRKNVGESYNGLLKIRVRSSSILNRKIAGWIKGVLQYV